MGRKTHDVFVLGDEALGTELDGTEDGGSVWVDEAGNKGTEYVEGQEVTSTTVRHPASSVPRRLAVLGLCAGAAMVVVASTLLAGGADSPSAPPRRSSSVVSPPPLETATAAKPAAVPSPPPRRHSHRLTKHAGQPRQEARSSRGDELQRETTEGVSEAQGSPVAVIPSALSVPSVVPVPVTSPSVRSPLPPEPGGSGSGGGEEFGFER